jgi:hypothetical protein
MAGTTRAKALQLTLKGKGLRLPHGYTIVKRTTPKKKKK